MNARNGDSPSTASVEPSDTAPRGRCLRPLLVFGAITFVLVVIVLAVAEVTLQSIGFPYTPETLLRPHFVDAGNGRIKTDPVLAHEIEVGVRDQTFSRAKPKGVFRVAILGGSSVYLLKDAQRLKQRLVRAGFATSEEQVEVMNMGMGGCGSDRAVVSARQVLRFDLDALLLYCGHNEFISQSNRRSYRQANWLSRNSKVVQLVAGNPWKPDPIRFYAADDKRIVYAQFEQNLRNIQAMSRDAGVPLIWGTVSSNLAIPPVVYWNRDYVDLDSPRSSWIEYRRGIDLLRQGRIDDAKTAFQQSFDSSPGSHRATRPINRMLRDAAAELSVPLADVEQRIIEQAPHGLPGINTGYFYELAFEPYQKLDGLFHDHCHLNGRGNEILIDTFADVLIDELRRARK